MYRRVADDPHGKFHFEYNGGWRASPSRRWIRP